MIETGIAVRAVIVEIEIATAVLTLAFFSSVSNNAVASFIARSPTNNTN